MHESDKDKGTIDWNIIRTHWQEMMQIALSIQAGKLWPSTLLKKLSSYSHKNKLYQAFSELGQEVGAVKKRSIRK